MKFSILLFLILSLNIFAKEVLNISNFKTANGIPASVGDKLQRAISLKLHEISKKYTALDNGDLNGMLDSASNMQMMGESQIEVDSKFTQAMSVIGAKEAIQGMITKSNGLYVLHVKKMEFSGTTVKIADQFEIKFSELGAYLAAEEVAKRIEDPKYPIDHDIIPVEVNFGKVDLKLTKNDAIAIKKIKFIGKERAQQYLFEKYKKGIDQGIQYNGNLCYKESIAAFNNILGAMGHDLSSDMAKINSFKQIKTAAQDGILDSEIKLKNEEIKQKLNEIKELITKGNIEKAYNALMDLVTDFNNLNKLKKNGLKKAEQSLIAMSDVLVAELEKRSKQNHYNFKFTEAISEYNKAINLVKKFAPYRDQNKTIARIKTKLELVNESGKSRFLTNLKSLEQKLIIYNSDHDQTKLNQTIMEIKKLVSENTLWVDHPTTKAIYKEIKRIMPSAFINSLAGDNYHNNCVITVENVQCWGSHFEKKKKLIPIKNASQVGLGLQHVCTLDDGNVKCVGENEYGQTKVPLLKNVKQLAVQSLSSCALDDDGVKCWGSDTYSIMSVPSLKKPRQLAMGYSNACALDDDGVKCWGEKNTQINSVPALKNPQKVIVGQSNACAIDDEVIKCWGDSNSKINKVPGGLFESSIKKPLDVAVSNSYACALDSNGVTCWGSPYIGLFVDVINNAPKLKNPTRISLSAKHGCVLGDNEVKCWGENQKGQINVPPLQNPRDIIVGDNHSCALDDSGLKCWGELNDKLPADLISQDKK